MPESEKPLRVGSFAAHATRGFVREKRARRALMIGSIGLALLLVLAGVTILPDLFSRHEAPFIFLLYWIACGWLTITALLLAAFDLLVIRAHTRGARRTLAELHKAKSSDSGNPA
jgi:hypothetical protein